MTRLNLVDPQHLTKRHLLGEWKEIFQGIHIYRKRAMQENPMKGVPDHYKLMGGHVLFFMDKGKYLCERFEVLRKELERRGINYDMNRFNERLADAKAAFPPEWYNDYDPTPEAYKIVIERIGARILQKPHLYPDADTFFDNLHYYGEGFTLSADAAPLALKPKRKNDSN